MSYLHTSSLSVCLGLFACAAGVDELTQTPGPEIVTIAEAGTPDSAPPSVASAAPDRVPVVVVTLGIDGAVSPAAGPWPDDSTRMPAAAPDAAAGLPPRTLDAAGIGQGATPIDAALSQPALDAASSDARSPISDARAAEAAPEAAAACEISRCDNFCGLAQRCCNARQECACLSLLRTCTLPSLPRPGLP